MGTLGNIANHCSTGPETAGDGVSYEQVKAFFGDDVSRSRLRESVRIAGECFGARSIKLSLQGDPEAHENWIEIAVDARGTVQQLIEAERLFTHRIRNEVSIRARSFVRLYLTSADD